MRTLGRPNGGISHIRIYNRCVHFQSASSTFENDAASTKERNSAASSEVKPPANRMKPGALRSRDEAKPKALAISVLAA